MKKILLGIIEFIVVLALMAVIGFFGYKMLIENRDSDSANYAGKNEEKMKTLLNDLKADLDTQKIDSTLVDYSTNKVVFSAGNSKASLFYNNSSFTYTNFLGENKVYKLINYNVTFDKDNVFINSEKVTNVSSTFKLNVNYTYPTGEKGVTEFTYVSNNPQLKYCEVSSSSVEKCYNTVYVSYNFNYPSGEKSDVQRLEKVDEKFDFPKTKVIDGYRLVGWYDEKENGKLYDETNVVKATDNGLILYAIWEPEVYRVVLDEVVDETSFVYYKYKTKNEKTGCIYYADPNLIRCIQQPITNVKSTSGKYFDGFYTSKDGEGIQYINSNGYFTNDLYERVVKDPSGLNLYINWTTKSYSISYNLNGGEPGVNSPTFGTSGRPVNVSYPKKPGFKFKGWRATNLEAGAKYGKGPNDINSIFDGNTPVDATFFKNLRQNSGTVTLIANWEEVKYQVSYNLNGGCFGTTTCTSENYRNDLYNEEYFLYSDTIKIKNPIKPGYKFKGWTAVGVSGDTAIYKDDEFSIEHPWDGLKVVVPADTSALGYTYFSKLSSSASGAVTFIANWETIGYKIEVDPAGGKIVENAPESVGFSEVFKVPKPIKDGYDFAGWKVTGVDVDKQARYGTSAQSMTQKFTNKEADGSFLAKGEYFASLTTEENKTIHFEATWELGTYTIVYNGTGGVGRMEDTKCDRDKECLLRKNTFTKDGYEFAGWGTSLNSGIVYKDSDKVFNLVETGTKTLYAIWKKK